MLILVDQDGPLAQFEAGFRAEVVRLFGEAAAVRLEDRSGWELACDYEREFTEAIYTEAGFYLGLVPEPGAIDALDELCDAGHDVRICTSPIRQWKHCVAEKFGWIEEHLGSPWTGRIITTRDKTLVAGAVLVDDKPQVQGVMRPAWQHICYRVPGLGWAQRAAVLAGEDPFSWSGNWREILGAHGVVLGEGVGVERGC